MGIEGIEELKPEPQKKLIGPPHAHQDAPCTDACYEDVDPGDGGAYENGLSLIREAGVDNPVTIPPKYGKSITLSITVKDENDWIGVWSNFASVAASIGRNFPAVHLNTYDLDALGEEDEDKPVCAEEHLFHDALTLEKFKTLLQAHFDINDQQVVDFVSEFQNAGLLVRERHVQGPPKDFWTED